MLANQAQGFTGWNWLGYLYGFTRELVSASGFGKGLVLSGLETLHDFQTHLKICIFEKLRICSINNETV